jgi:O-antigen/teichoic acid export membrane protein
MRLSFGRATIITAVSDATLVAASLLVTRLLLRTLGPETYGILGLVTVLAGQVSVLQFGLGPALTRLIAERRGQGDAAGVAALWHASGLLGSLSSAAVGVGFTLLAYWGWHHGFQGSPEVVAEALASLGAAALVVAMGPFLSTWLGFLMGQERFGLVALLRLVHGLMRVGVAALALLLGGRIRAIFFGQAAVDGLAALIAMVASRPRGLTSRLPAPERSRAIKAILVIGFPMAAVSILYALLSDTEKLAIALTKSMQDFTYYTVPFNVVSRTAILATALWRLLIPRVSRIAATGDHRMAADLAARATRLSVGLTTTPLLFLAAAAPELLTVWLGPEFAARSTAPARILMIGTLIGIAGQPSSAVLWAKASPRLLALVQAAEVPLHLVVVYLLVRYWGVEGAAGAWCVRVLIDCILTSLLARRELHHTVLPIRSAAWAIGALGVSMALFEVKPMSLAARTLLAIVAALISLRSLDTDDWKMVWRNIRPDTITSS